MEANLAHGCGVPEEDILRARIYALLARLLAAPITEEDQETIRALEGDGTEMGAALGSLATIAAKTSLKAATDEYDTLFIGLVQGELVPYASYYLTGFLQEKPLAELRSDMVRLGIARSDDLVEPEDHIAVVCEMMHGLITGVFGEAASIETQKDFFDSHIRPWACRFFQDLEAAESAVLYMPVGTIGRVFMEVEVKAFEMTA